MVKTRENRGEKPRLNNFRTTLPVVRIFRTTHPLCEFAFVPIFKKCMLSVPSQNLNAKITGIRTLCEFVFVVNFQNHALCLGEPQECEIHISSLKAIFSSSNSKLLLHFSQAKDLSHSFFIRNPLPPGRGASKFQVLLLKSSNFQA